MLKKYVKILFFALSIVFLGGCGRKDKEIPELLMPIGAGVDTAVVAREDIYELSTYDATVYPDTQEVSFTVDGKISQIAVFTGQEVKKGDLLVSVEDESQKEELERQKEELKFTKKNYEFDNEQQDIDIQILRLNIELQRSANAAAIDLARMEVELEKLEMLQVQTHKLQELEIQKVQKKIDAIENEFEKKQIVAPCSGSVVYLKNIRVGDYVRAYDTVVIISDESKLHIQGEYIQENIIKAASQTYAIINGKEYDIEYIPLQIDEIIEMNNSGIRMESKYIFEAEDDITSGDYACVSIKEKLKKDVLIIPKKALFGDAEGSFVYRVVEGNFERCSIEVGTKTDIQVEITSGLVEGDVVYVQE